MNRLRSHSSLKRLVTTSRCNITYLVNPMSSHQLSIGKKSNYTTLFNVTSKSSSIISLNTTFYNNTQNLLLQYNNNDDDDDG